MSSFNKIITNMPVSLNETEISNLSNTLSGIIQGGGGETRRYVGDGVYVTINNDVNPALVTLTQTSIEKLDRDIPTKVSDLTDSASYQTTAGMSGYLTTGDAANTYQPKGDYLSANALDDYYQKTETSGVSELNTAFGSKQDNLTQEQLSAISSVSSIKGTVLAGDANIRTTSAEDGNNIKWTIELTAQPVVTDTTLSGYDGIVATKDSIVNSQWNIGIAQAYKEQIEAVSSKLTETVANTLYAPISVTGDIDTLKTSSGDWDKVSAKLDTSAFSSVSGNFITASQPFTANLGGASKITVYGESNLEVSQHSNVIFTQNSQFSAINNNLLQGEGNSYNAGGGASFIQGQYNTGAYCSMAQGLHNNAGNQSQAFGIGNVITNTGMAIGTYNKTSSDASFVIGNGTNSNRSDLFIIKHDGTVSSTGDFIVDGKSLSSVYNTVSANSGEWLKESDLNYYVTSGDITTQDTDYVMTTNGWMPLSANYYSKRESDDRYVTTANVGSGLYYSGSSPKLGVKLGTDLAFDANGFIKVDTNGVATGTYAFVEGESNTANGNASHAEGFTNNIINSYSHGEGRNNTEFGGNTNHLEGGYNKVNSPENGGYVHIEGEANEVTGHSIHIEGAYNIFNSTSTADRGISIEGYANATTANDTSVHDGVLKVIGNGKRVNSSTINRSDAYILYHDGTVSAKQFQNADGTETINGTTYNFSGVDNIEILPNAATANTANFPNDNVLRFILES